jgi:hypothetical protein
MWSTADDQQIHGEHRNEGDQRGDPDPGGHVQQKNLRQTRDTTTRSSTFTGVRGDVRLSEVSSAGTDRDERWRASRRPRALTRRTGR